MTVSHGMDPVRVRQIGEQLRIEARRAHEVAGQGTAGVATLEGAWEGPDLESFSQGWTSARPTLDAASTRLSTFADQLLEQADSQESASEAGGAGGGGAGGGPGGGGGTGGSGSGGSPGGTVSDVIDDLGFWTGRLGDAAGIATGIGTWKYGQFNPRGRLPSGRHGFLGHKPGSPFSTLPWTQRARLYGSNTSWIPKGGPNAATNVSRYAGWSKVARISGPVGATVSGVFGGVDQWAEDMGDPSIGTGERTTRAVTNGVTTGGTTLAMAAGGAKVGAVAGGLVGGPVGAAIGGVAGGIIGGVAGSKAGDAIGGAAADASSWVGDKLGLW